jgi:hypothetical protein
MTNQKEKKRVTRFTFLLTKKKKKEKTVSKRKRKNAKKINTIIR